MGLLAAKRAGFPTISYLPMAHPLSVSGKPVALRFREMVNGYLYRTPDRFITISESARGMLLERGARDVLVVPNTITSKPLLPSDREKFREKHGIRTEQYLVGVIGRIDFRQKGQDFALEAISRFRQQLCAYKFLFVGDGPDTKKLEAMIMKTNLSEVAQVLPWDDDLGKLYAALDMLLIPSRFEGVPLVMLEAMFHKLPIIASNVDAMAEFLPQSWLFRFGDHQALFDRLKNITNVDNSNVFGIAPKTRLRKFHRRAVLRQDDCCNS